MSDIEIHITVRDARDILDDLDQLDSLWAATDSLYNLLRARVEESQT